MIFSILDSTKKAVGVDVSSEHYDDEIIGDINSALLTLSQFGAGKPETLLMIEDSSTEWEEFFEFNELAAGIKQFIALKTRLRFDPPKTSYELIALKEQIQEIEWRILAEIEKEGVVITEGASE